MNHAPGIFLLVGPVAVSFEPGHGMRAHHLPCRSVSSELVDLHGPSCSKI